MQTTNTNELSNRQTLKKIQLSATEESTRTS